MAGPLTLYQTGVHGSRPAASSGCVLYSCTTHSLVYKSDGSSWTTFLTIPTGSGVATDPIWDAAGDLAVGTGADTAAKLTKGSDGTLLRMASGSVGWGRVPLCGAKAYNVGTQTIATGVEAAITFGAEEYDTDTFHDTGSNTSRFVAPVTGKYRLTATLWFASGLTNANGSMSFYTNGATIGSSTIVRGGSNGAIVQFASSGAGAYNLSAEAIIAAGDYAEVKFFNGAPGNVVVGHASAAALESTMSICLIGV